MKEENITAVEGAQARIVCEFDANPVENNTVTWYRDNTELEVDEERMFTDMEGILDIQEVSRDDVGLYSCAVENSVGKGYSEGSTSLDVYCEKSPFCCPGSYWPMFQTPPMCTWLWSPRWCQRRLSMVR